MAQRLAVCAASDDVSRKRVVAALAADEWRQRFAAVRALVDQPREALSGTLGALDDPVPGVRWAAVSSVARWYGDAPERADLLDALVRASTDQAATVRRAAVWRLRPGHGPVAYRTLLRALGDADPRVRIVPSYLLRDRAAVSELIAALDDPFQWIVFAAAESLAAIGDPRAVDPLVAKLGARKRPVRVAAIRALRELGDRRALQPLQALLARSTTDVVRRASRDAIWAIAPETQPDWRLRADSSLRGRSSA